ncbi:hypothetical protein M2137_000837 [Parabacteroides sp. PFB2-10]|uniref:hypothetical protein n=1 Tax=Parabacteroides sp. PFB2-10 TaxID=1742405 RepID=UPI002474D3DE|nr:hypothetical protein [Parabacteroides sp. PFB2-10]MDH6312074.1 hypothetical protein [Parabacteroides sp. PFB2-10]MDL2208748.1 hypothetical protein [Parabacteroides sp. OttesenSCG-928-O15]MDL2245727.1 hypothetical protein [Parabacteroides sp. OttesenSCG-928-J18]
MRRGSRLDELFTLLFMVLAIGAVICFFALRGDRTWFLILGGIAVVLRVVQYVMRYVGK